MFSNASPFQSISFLLPMLCQITMENDGCKLFASAGAFGAVRQCFNCIYSSWISSCLLQITMSITSEILFPIPVAGCWLPYFSDWFKWFKCWQYWYHIVGMWYNHEFSVKGITCSILLYWTQRNQSKWSNFFIFAINRESNFILPWRILVLSSFCKHWCAGQVALLL